MSQVQRKLSILYGCIFLLQLQVFLVRAHSLFFEPQWTQLNDLNVLAIAISDHNIYFAHATYFDENNAPISVSKWDGCKWSTLPGIYANSFLGVRALAVDGNYVYAGGEFQNASGNPNATNIAKWNGTTWTELGSGLNGQVFSIVINRGEVFAGGGFTNAGGIPGANGIARWDGEKWNALGEGLFFVTTIAVAESGIYAGGVFENAGNDPDADKIARWDGSAWHALGTGMGPTTYQINKIVLNADIVYVQGNFINAGGNSHADHIAKWDGQSWGNLGQQLEDEAEYWPLCTDGHFIYSMYRPALATVDTLKVMRWDEQKQTWDPVSYQHFECEWPTALVASDNNLYYGGAWTIGSTIGCGLWKWGEIKESITITGVPDSVCAYDPPLVLPVTQSGYPGYWSGPGVLNNIFDPAGLTGLVTLQFTPDPSHCIDAVVDSIEIACTSTTATEESAKSIPSLRIFPNPTSEIIKFELKNLDTESNIVTLRSVTGQILFLRECAEGEINMTNLSPGIYFLTAQSNYNYSTTRIIKL